MAMTQLDTSPPRVGESPWMDEKRCRSRQVSGIVYTSSECLAWFDQWNCEGLERGGLGWKLMSPCLCYNQSPEDTENMRAATSLQREEVIVNARLPNSTAAHAVTMKGGTHFLATTYLSPKPAFHTGMSTSAFPPREGTLRPTCWRLGEAIPRRDTLTTLTSDDLTHRRAHQRVTVLWARTASNQPNLRWEASNRLPSPDLRLGLTPHHSGPPRFPHMVLLEICPAGPVQHVGGGPIPLGLLRPKDPPLPKANSRENTDLNGNLTTRQGVNHNVQINTVWTLRSSTRIWSLSPVMDPQPSTKNVMRDLEDHLWPELRWTAQPILSLVTAVVCPHPGMATVATASLRRGSHKTAGWALIRTPGKGPSTPYSAPRTLTVPPHRGEVQTPHRVGGHFHRLRSQKLIRILRGIPAWELTDLGAIRWEAWTHYWSPNRRRPQKNWRRCVLDTGGYF